MLEKEQTQYIQQVDHGLNFYSDLATAPMPGDVVKSFQLWYSLDQPKTNKK